MTTPKIVDKAEKRDFYVDSSLKRRRPGEPATGGSAPEGHPRRCQRMNKFGVQCHNWATKKRNYCRFHGGRVTYGKKQGVSYYAKFAGKKLKDKLDELAKMTPSERMDLSAEVDIMRELGSKAIAIYGKVVEEGALDKDGQANVQAREAAERGLVSALDRVSVLVEKMAKIEVMKSDKISVHNIKYVTKQIIDIIEKELRDQPEVKKRVLDRILEMKICEDSVPKVVLNIG